MGPSRWRRSATVRRPRPRRSARKRVGQRFGLVGKQAPERVGSVATKDRMEFQALPPAPAALSTGPVRSWCWNRDSCSGWTVAVRLAAIAVVRESPVLAAKSLPCWVGRPSVPWRVNGARPIAADCRQKTRGTPTLSAHCETACFELLEWIAAVLAVAARSENWDSRQDTRTMPCGLLLENAGATLGCLLRTCPQWCPVLCSSRETTRNCLVPGRMRQQESQGESARSFRKLRVT
jgi:hypothetical protein